MSPDAASSAARKRAWRERRGMITIEVDRETSDRLKEIAIDGESRGAVIRRLAGLPPEGDA